MNQHLMSVWAWGVVVLIAGIAAKADGADLSVPPKTSAAWTLEQATRQMTLNPADPYLQYVALQLARADHKTNEVGQTIDQLNRRGRRGPERDVDLFVLFSGALAVQESLQLDSMREGPPGVGAPMGDPTYETVNVADLTGPQVKSHPWGEMLAAQNVAGRTPGVPGLSRVRAGGPVLARVRLGEQTARGGRAG